MVCVFIRAAPAPAAELAVAEEMRVEAVVKHPRFRAAVAVFERDHERFVAELVALTEIPAPPFGEKRRAAAYLDLLREAGLQDCTMDAEGNVMGLWRGRRGGPLLAVAAHLDTVFPAATDVKVQRVGTRLFAPGVSDDSYGLAFLVALARAMRDAGWETAGDILIVGNVGEEGAGDLRGVRHLFGQPPWKDKLKRFITVDGRSNDMIANGGLGSIRYRVTFRGPGGHSWSAFGQVSPAFAMGNAIAKLGRLDLRRRPKVSYNVGVVSGGTSVNSIPHEVMMEVDLRSVAPEALRQIDADFKRLVAEAVDEENAARATTFGKVAAELQLIGERPAGLTPPDSPLLRQVTATMRVFDKIPVWETTSTDANWPMSLGIPAFAMAAHAATRAGRAHSLEEWVDVEKTGAIKDFELAAAIILTAAELP